MLGWHTQCNSEQEKMIQKVLYNRSEGREISKISTEPLHTFRGHASDTRKTYSRCLKLKQQVAQQVMKCTSLYLASNFVIMKIHGRPSVLTGLQGVDELLRNHLTEADIVTAAAPEPSVTTYRR